MKHEDEERPEEIDSATEAELERAAPPLKALLKRSLSSEAAPDASDTATLLASVQRKLRKRSDGKFYADGWSTSKSRVNYALVAVVMLITLAAVYVALGPTGFGP